MGNTGITITNFKQVMLHLSKLDLHDKANVAKARTVLRAPFNSMRADARSNLKSQKSINSGNLYRGLSVGTKASKSKGYFTVAFGARGKATNKGKNNLTPSKKGGRTAPINHFHLVNSGTVKRFHRNKKFVGVVGKGTSSRPNMNKSFKIGFADRAIRTYETKIEGLYVRGFSSIINGVRTGGT